MNKRGDLLDGILFYSGKSYPEHFLDYPEQVIQTLYLFYDIWKIPEGAVPSKKEKSKFERWINEFETLNKICPSRFKMEKAMKLAHENHQSSPKEYPVSHPLSIQEFLINATRVINTQNSLHVLEEEKIVKVIEIQETDEQKKKFKNKLNELLED